MSDAPNTPKDDAERIRLKRLAKLSSAPASNATPSPPATPAPPKVQAVPPATPKRVLEQPVPATSSTPPRKKAAPALQSLPIEVWERVTLSEVFLVTLSRDAAERSGFKLVWLKSLAEELNAEDPSILRPPELNFGLIDRILIARLELDANAMTDDLEYLPIIASLPPQQTVFEYLIGCWKRINVARADLRKKQRSPADLQEHLAKLENLRDLVISYAGLTLQDPDMFPQPDNRAVGAPEFVTSLLSLSTLATPLASAAENSTLLTPAEVEPFLQDIAHRFSSPDELIGVLGPVVRQLLFHESLWRAEGLSGGDSVWRGVVGGLEALVSIKSIATMITQMEDWNPEITTPAAFEKMSLMGPLCRLGVFQREWPAIADTYFSQAQLDKITRTEVDSTNASLRGTLKSLQYSLFQIFNAIVRASPEAREAVLQYFARVIKLNLRRGGMQVEFDTVSSDGFMINLQAVLLRFAEPFMDAKYSKIDRIDPAYYVHSSRIDVSEETRINATSEDVTRLTKEVKDIGDAPPVSFISDIFYLTVAMDHYGLQRTIQSYEELGKHIEDMQRQLDMLNSDTSWQGTPMQARAEAAINGVKAEMAKIRGQQFAFQVQLMDPELIFRNIGFINFLSTWLIRLVDPKHTHPNPLVALPLPKEVPATFRMLPEYFFEDIVEYFLFVVRYAPESLDLSGKNELLVFALTFLTSTWYIKNPFLKAKINEAIFYGTISYGRERNGVLGGLLNSHPVALKHLMSAMMGFYVEVEQTGASSQFYDKFNARRNIAYILKAIWNNPTHREALAAEALNVDKFVRFVNLMINDVTYLLDESLSELSQIHAIQVEMANQETWNAKPTQYRREREGTLRQLERHASGYTTLGKSTVGLLKDFTSETKQPFMEPEIVGRLGAMLDYNLDALVGPKCRDLKVKDPEKYKFNPRQLLSDIVQVYLNLAGKEEFVRAVADDGRSYKKELFDRAAIIARKNGLKSEEEIEQLQLFVVKVEEMKATLEAEEDLGEIPDEFLDPLMATVMRDPVILPSSRAVVDRSTIKSHLLSDIKDPFNRVPLSIEDVIPNPELKARIDAFLIERRNKNKAPDVAQDEVMKIDESAD